MNNTEVKERIIKSTSDFDINFLVTKPNSNAIDTKVKFDDFVKSLEVPQKTITLSQFIKINQNQLEARYSKTEREKIGFLQPNKTLGFLFINEWFQNQINTGNHKLIAKNFFTFFNVKQDSIRFLTETTDSYIKEYSFNDKTKQYDIINTDLSYKQDEQVHEYEYLRVPLLKYSLEKAINSKETPLKDNTFVTSITVDRNDYKKVQIIARSVEKYVTISYLFGLIIKHFADILLVLIESPNEINRLANNIRKKNS